jgi:hypothetical protein
MTLEELKEQRAILDAQFKEIQSKIDDNQDAQDEIILNELYAKLGFKKGSKIEFFYYQECRRGVVDYFMKKQFSDNFYCIGRFINKDGKVGERKFELSLYRIEGYEIKVLEY